MGSWNDRIIQWLGWVRIYGVMEPWDPTTVGVGGTYGVMEPWDPTMVWGGGGGPMGSWILIGFGSIPNGVSPDTQFGSRNNPS